MDRVFVISLGVVCPVASDGAGLLRAVRAGRSGIAPLSLFEAGRGELLPVGQVSDAALAADEALPRTHRLALSAAHQAVAEGGEPPDAVVLGGTTGGVLRTEELLLAGDEQPASYALHGTGTVARTVARAVGCRGPALTVSTACSSGAVALTVGAELLRRGLARRVLAGGADSLCRLTYHGFQMLKLIDPAGARPLDAGRRGMSVAEGAALLLLQAAPEPPPGALAELRGGGLSCDAHHATAPHPEGDGAARAVEAALADAGLSSGEVHYVNLHGTGTVDNDAAEAKAIRRVFGGDPPPLSSTKGLTGHSLAAAGAVEAALSVLLIQEGLLPANVGLQELDPELGLSPLRQSRAALLDTVLSNSFGFGGNNAALVLTRPRAKVPPTPRRVQPGHRVAGAACLTAAGGVGSTLAALARGETCAGLPDGASLCPGLPPRSVRRLKRLPRMVLGLAEAAGAGEVPFAQVYFGTGFGPLSETFDFVEALFASQGEFSSPSDFVGSVHNAPAGQVALRWGARGQNVTATDGDVSFEQALWLAELLSGAPTEDEAGVLLIGADEHHGRYSPLLDPHTAAAGMPSDGGGALLLLPEDDPRAKGPRLRTVHYAPASTDPEAGARELLPLLGLEGRDTTVGALWLGIPPSTAGRGQALWHALRPLLPAGLPLFHHRQALGQHPTVAATATALAAHLLMYGAPELAVGSPLSGALPPPGQGILLLSLGDPVCVAALIP